MAIRGIGMLIVGEWLFDPQSRRLDRGQEERRLSPKAADVLLALADKPGQVWSRDALLERVWPGVIVGEEVLTHAVAEIRRALSDDFRAPHYLETVHKRGYRLLCAVPTQPPAHVGGRESFDLQAYASYLMGCDLYERGGLANTYAAIELFASAIRADPAFALAHVALARASTFLDYFHPTDVNELLGHCRTARELKPDLADAYAIEGFILAVAGDFGRSTKCFGTAIDLRPDCAETLYLLSRVCMATVALTPAAVMLERAAVLRSDDYHAAVLSGKVRQMVGDERRAASNFAQALPRVEARLGAYPDDFRALSDKARCLWSLGRTDEALGATDLAAEHPDPMPYQLACVLARAGRAEAALDTFEAAVECGWRYRAWLDRDPDFDPLRGNRRFKRMTASIGEMV